VKTLSKFKEVLHLIRLTASGIQSLETVISEFRAHLNSLVLQASRQSFYDATHHSVIGTLHKNANARSVAYIEKFIGDTMFFFTREELWDFALGSVEVEGLILEFGVSDGYSINYIAKKVNQEVYGFDGFTGLPDNWAGASLLKGYFARNGSLPEVEKNVSLVVGEFSDTLENFIRETSSPIRLVHVDSDLFSSCELILSKLARQLIPGSILIFDEYLGFPGWESGEFLAFQNFASSQKRNYAYLGFSQNQAAVKLL
jgi:hypothetical protein